MLWVFWTISNKEVLTWIIHCRLEVMGNLWARGHVDFLWLLMDRMICIFTEQKRGEREKGILLQAAFFEIPKSYFVLILALSFLLRWIFSSWRAKLCIQKRALDSAQHELIEMWKGSDGYFGNIAAYPPKFPWAFFLFFGFFPFSLPRLGKTLLLSKISHTKDNYLLFWMSRLPAVITLPSRMGSCAPGLILFCFVLFF